MPAFHSRPLASADGSDDPPFMHAPHPRHAPSGIMGRLRACVAWAKARGGKRLLRDGALWGGGFLLLYGLFLWWTLPNISDPRSLIAAQSSVITDRNGVELYRLYQEENRTFIPGELIPKHLKHAIVAIEDERFYERGCLDIQAIARVLFRFGQAGGASTLTRQLARNALDLKNENIVNRKIKELILGCQLESRYSKEELLDLYLNWIPFGQNAYGVELASKTYFNISAQELTLPQSAILAALPQRPSYFSPYGKHVRTAVAPHVEEEIRAGKITDASDISDEEVTIGLLGTRIGSGALSVYVGGRTDQVLRNMQNLGYITQEERLSALNTLETIVFQPSRENIRAPHFVLWVKAQVENLLGSAEEGLLSQGGLTIETTLDWEMQRIAEQVIASKREDIANVYGAQNIALLSTEVGTNRILAYVGNADYSDEEHDGKVDMVRAPRQPGSSFKPFVYAAAFEKGFSPATVLFDVPTKIGDDTPQNFDGQFWGLMNARRALASSRNIPAAKAFFLAGGEESVLRLASRLGVTAPSEQKRALQINQPDFEYGWPLALGAAETPLLEMTQAYATLANGGTFTPLQSIERITDRRGNILYQAKTLTEGASVLDPRIAYAVTSILSDTAARPNEYWQTILSVPGVQSAAKTGTSNKCLERDEKQGCTDRKPDNLWTMGYTPNIVTGVWIGNADATPLSPKAESLSLAAPIWKEFMTKAHKLLERPVTAFSLPSGLVQPQISLLSGTLPTECTPVEARKADVFLEENAPSSEDPACVRLEVDRVTGLLPSAECPAEAREEMSFFAPQEVLADRFPEWQAAVLAWAKKQMESYDQITHSFSGSSLPLPLVPTEECRLSLTPGRTEKPSLTLSFPLTGGTASYPVFQPRIAWRVGAAIRELRVELDGKLLTTLTEEPFDLTVRVPRSISQEGSHTLTVTLVDSYFNTASDSASFTFEEDRLAPTVRFMSPRGDLEVRPGESLMFEAQALDDESGIKHVEFFLDDTLLSSKPSAPYRLPYNAPTKPGTYRLRVSATDFADNRSEDGLTLTVAP